MRGQEELIRSIIGDHLAEGLGVGRERIDVRLVTGKPMVEPGQGCSRPGDVQEVIDQGASVFFNLERFVPR